MGLATNEPNDYVAFAKQTAKDTEGTSFYFLKHAEGSGFEVETEMVREREGGSGQEIGLSYKSQVKADGSLNQRARADFTGRVLAGVLGADTPSAVFGSGILTDHTLSPVATTPYYTVEQRSMAGVVERTSNAKLSEVNVEFEAGRALQISAAFLSAGTYHAGGAGQAPTREETRPFLYPGASFAISGASGLTAMTKGAMKLKRGIDDGIQTNTLFREDLVELTQDYEFDGTFKFINADLYRRAHLAAVAGGSLVTQDIATIGVKVFAAQGSHSVDLNMPLLEVTGVKPNRFEPDGKTVYLDVAGQSIKGGTHSFWARVRSDATSTYA